MRHTFSIEQIEEAMESQSGFCTACGEESDCVEPDARRYECNNCGENRVYGAEELALMGLVN